MGKYIFKVFFFFYKAFTFFSCFLCREGTSVATVLHNMNALLLITMKTTKQVSESIQ